MVWIGCAIKKLVGFGVYGGKHWRKKGKREEKSGG
jgi:hypothetical protein